MFTLSLIGIGSGNPKHLTLQAIDALNACDVILIPSKGAGKDDLAGLRHEICAQVLRSDGPYIHEFTLPKRDAANPDYHAGVHDWHDAITQVWLAEMQRTLPQGGRVGLAKGPKDPSRRLFIKGMGALTLLPIVGKYLSLIHI